ncbi:hypothetical protein QEN19_002580 [Hanseniaspora menglaensis]
MGLFNNKRSRASIVGDYNTISSVPSNRANSTTATRSITNSISSKPQNSKSTLQPIHDHHIQQEFNAFGGKQVKGDLLGKQRKNSQDYTQTVTTTSVTTIEYYDKATGTVKKKRTTRTSSITNDRPFDNRANSITNGKPSSNSNKQYKYVPTGKGLKLVEVDIAAEEEKLRTNQIKRQSSMVRRSDSKLFSNTQPSSHFQQPVTRQSSNLSIKRAGSIQSRQIQGKIERANSGLAAAKIATGAQEPVQLTTKSMKKRNSMLNMKSATNNVNSTLVLQKSPSFIREESPSQMETDVSKNGSTLLPVNKKVRRATSFKNGLSINPQKRENVSSVTELLEKPSQIIKPSLKVTPIKVDIKKNIITPNNSDVQMKNSTIAKEDKEFLKFQESTEKMLKNEQQKPLKENKKEKSSIVDSANSNEHLTTNSLEHLDAVKELKKESDFNFDDPEDADRFQKSPESVKMKVQESLYVNKEPLFAEDVNFFELNAINNINDKTETSINSNDEITKKASIQSKDSGIISAKEMSDIIEPPVIQLSDSQEHLEIQSPSRNALKLQTESKETVYLDTYEQSEFLPPSADFMEKTVDNNNQKDSEYEDNKFITPIKEKPLKSAIRSKSKYEKSNSFNNNKTPKQKEVAKSPAQDAYIKLTTAENTRLNSQLQDANQKKSKIVRSPSKRVSLRIQQPTQSNLKTGSSMSQRMKSSPLNNGQYQYTYKAKIKPNMNVTLEAPKLTALERKSSFERERAGNRLGFGNMSMREEADTYINEANYNHGANHISNFKSRFVDSDDEFDLPPQITTKSNHVNTLRVPKSSNISDPQEHSKKKKSFGGKLKKLFGKKK